MISLDDLMTIVLFLLGATLLCFLIFAVSNLLRVLRNVNQLIEKNKDNIDKTVEKLPEIAENASKITGMVKNNLNDIQHVFENVGKISDTVKKGVDTIQNDIVLKAKSIVDLIDVIRRFFEKRKDQSKNNKSRKKKGTVYTYKYKPGQEQPEEIQIQTDEAIQEPYRDYVKVESESESTADSEADITEEPDEEMTEDITDYQEEV
jgi:uncharacterized protein YoxC